MRSSLHVGHSGIVPRIGCTLWILVLAGLALGLSRSAFADTGKWSPAADWHEGDTDLVAIHMVLLPGDATFHSRLLWWGNENPGVLFRGREMGWRPGTSGCDLFPSSFTNLGAPAPSGMNVFCAGHTGLADGRTLIAGGTHPINGDYGENKARIFTKGSGLGTGNWCLSGLPPCPVEPAKMKDWRWYPSATTLRDGRVLVTSGTKPANVWTFGGRRGGSSPSSPTGDSLYRFAPVIRWCPASC